METLVCLTGTALACTGGKLALHSMLFLPTLIRVFLTEVTSFVI